MEHPDHQMTTIDARTDAELVAASLRGDRGAFRGIVEKYQRLLCSLAYAATGNLSESEDLAQDAFIAAWRELAGLREPERLRPWLCTILRHQVSRRRRQDGREPVRQAGALDEAEVLATDAEAPPEVVMNHEEQALMWTALAQVPAIYREPLILYYREHRSVEHVAVALDLTEDAVKQRLARGRKLLQERVLSFVEGALARSTPGRVFTLAVLAALPEVATPAKAAVLGAGAAHGSLLAKTTGLAALLASISGVVTTMLTLRATLDQSRTPRERRAVVAATIGAVVASLGLLAAVFALRAGSFRWWDERAIFAALSQVLVIGFLIAWPLGLVRMMRSMRQLRSQERRLHPASFQHPRDHVGSAAGEYRSRARLLGVPLLHMRFAAPDAGTRPVFGWVAVGDRAVGLLFAWGGYAIAPVSVGGVAVGFLAVGAMTIGVFGLGTFACGVLAVGAVGVGLRAYAWLSALGWLSAQSNGFAIAREAAEGPVAWARHANDAAARALLANPNAERNQMVYFIVIAVLSLVPVVLYARAVRQRMGGGGAASGRSGPPSA